MLIGKVAAAPAGLFGNNFNNELTDTARNELQSSLDGSGSYNTLASSAAVNSPTPHKTPIEAGAYITRDNYTWNTALGVPATINYAFRATTSSYATAGHNSQSTFAEFNATQIDAANLILSLWSDVANITFNRVGTGNSGAVAYSDNATILLGNYSDPSDASGAFSYYPSPNATASTQAPGDVWDNAYYNTNTDPTVGSYGWSTLLHELGHTLGLEHPGNYNAAPGVSITYAQNASYVEDSRQYTVMSYFEAFNTGANHVYDGTMYAATPLLDDITALQRLYGRAVQR